MKSLTPTSVLMLKGHSAGIGDILRGSAAWRALKDAFPAAGLHLLLLSREPGYASEHLMARHHLLAGFDVIDKRTRGIAGWVTLLAAIGAVVERARPDLVIDFEPHGLRTPLISLWLRLKYGVRTVGVNEVPLRGWFYSTRSVSSKAFAARRGLAFPLEYTNRDFVVLSALGLERRGTPIELEETGSGRAFSATFRERFRIPADARLIGLNIGCGTPDARYKRPDLGLLSEVVGRVQRAHGLTVVLTGAPFEKDINLAFTDLHSKRFPAPAADLAGETDLLQLAGLIRACALFISTDSGPYHMAVGLRVPTLAVFSVDSTIHFHHDPWVRCVLLREPSDVSPAVGAADALLVTAVRGAVP